MKNTTILFILAILLAGFAENSWAEKPENKKPNILYIFPDQYRIHAMGFWNTKEYNGALPTPGDPVVTPNIDKLASQSAVFTQVSSTHPVCSVHRAMLMSGIFPGMNGVEGVNCHADRPQGIRHDISSLTDVLHDAGYNTAYIGKTHWNITLPLFDENDNYVGKTFEEGGYYANPYDTYIAPGRGRFSNEYWFQFIGDSHNDAKAYSSEPALVNGKKDGEVHRPHTFTAKQEAEIIVNYIKNTNKQRDPNKPFSLIWAPNPPHSPYAQKSDVEAEIYEKYYANKPIGELATRQNADQAIAEKHMRYYFTHITSIDRYVGAVLDALEESGEAENTIVIFTSDHGDLMGSHALLGKNQIYDESFFVPFLIRYPAKIKHRIDAVRMGTTDLMPTLLALAGLQHQIPATVQGDNFAPGILSGNQADYPQRKSNYYIRSDKKGIQTDQYTYAVKKGGETELFDLQNDPYQMTALSLDELPEKEQQFLKEELGYWLNREGSFWANQQKYAKLINYPKEEKHSKISGLAFHPPFERSMRVGDINLLKYRIAPSNASNKEVSWSSSNPVVAKVNKNGKITALKPGSTIIEVRSVENKQLSASCLIQIVK